MVVGGERRGRRMHMKEWHGGRRDNKNTRTVRQKGAGQDRA